MDTRRTESVLAGAAGAMEAGGREPERPPAAGVASGSGARRSGEQEGNEEQGSEHRNLLTV